MIAIPSLSAVLGPFHILSYAALLGTELYQTFIATKVCFNALPLPEFRALQARLFPAYFRTQSILLFLTVSSIPPTGPMVFLERKDEGIAFAIAGLTALLNFFKFGPATRQAMIDRANQVMIENRQPRDSDGLSDEMKACNRKFSRVHAMSIHLNLISIIGMLYYGIRLGSRLQFD